MLIVHEFVLGWKQNAYRIGDDDDDEDDDNDVERGI